MKSLQAFHNFFFLIKLFGELKHFLNSRRRWRKNLKSATISWKVEHESGDFKLNLKTEDVSKTITQNKSWNHSLKINLIYCQVYFRMFGSRVLLGKINFYLVAAGENWGHEKYIWKSPRWIFQVIFFSPLLHFSHEHRRST